VLAPSQVGWSNAKTEEFKSKIRTFLQTQFRPAIADDDHIFQIDRVTTDTNESFTTIVITSKDGRPLFEPMLWFSTAEKKCSETQPPTGSQETSIDWSGYAKNVFGIELISWKGHATYRYKDGKLLTPDIWPGSGVLDIYTRSVLGGGQRRDLCQNAPIRERTARGVAFDLPNHLVGRHAQDRL
jgi:hypothetical protein